MTAAAQEPLEIRHEDGIAILRMAKPPVNAIEPAFLEALHDALAELLAEPPRALVLTGTGQFFSAGLDLKVMPTLPADRQRAMLERINELGRPLYGFPRPTVSAVNGHAVAAGFVLALAGDYRVASLEGTYGLTEVKAGMPYPVGALAAVQAELPAPAARRLVLGAELVDAEAALQMGAFDEVAPSDDVLPRSLEIAARLATYPSEVFARSKLALRAPMFASVDRILAKGDPLAGAWLGDESASAAGAILRGSGPR